jgi:O-antigen/teichoic acid export membrane protein
VGAVSLPALAGLAIVAPDFVDVVLGKKWHSAIPVLQVLTWVGFLQSLQTLNGPILQSLDKTGLLLRYSIVFFVAHLTAFVTGLHWGVVGVATAYAISTTVVEPLFMVVTSRALGISTWSFARGLTGVVEAAAVMAVAVLLLRILLVDVDVAALARLLILVAVGAAIYLPCCAWRVPEIRDEVRALRRHRSAARITAASQPA